MKFCVEEPELRKLFSSLIANSVDSDKANLIHPSYSEIIKQLTPFDAKVFWELSIKEDIPILRLRIDNVGKNECLFKPNMYLDSTFGNLELLQISLENLSRLKLIDIKLDQQYAEIRLYDKIIQNETFCKDVEDLKKQIEEGQKLEYSYGAIEITRFGKHFLNACS